MQRVQGKLLGTHIGRIRLIDFIGSGGVGEVYVGFDETLERLVAVKAIRSELRLHPETRSRFLREARMLSQLEHPNICRIYDLVEGEDNDYLVLELIDGANLREALAEGLDYAEKLRIIEQTVQALKLVHAHGVIHRDLKPENIMITTAGEVKVLDFGLAHTAHEEPDELTETVNGDPLATDQPESQHNSDSDIHTKYGSIIGTVGYMSPEQALGEPATAASDMYSLGLVMQEIFTGQRPFDEKLNPRTFLRMAALGRTRPVSGLRPELTGLIERLKSVAPGTRPSSVDTVERVHWIRNAPRRRRQHRLLAAMWLLLVLFGCVMALQAYRITQEKERATREAESALQVSHFLVEIFEISDPSADRGNTVTARELLDQGAAKVSRFDDQPLTQARLMDAIGTVYLQLGLCDKAAPLINRAYELRRRHHRSGHTELASSLHSLGNLCTQQGQLDQAETYLEQALAMQEQLSETGPAELAATLGSLAILSRARGDYEQAQRYQERADILNQADSGSQATQSGTNDSL